MPLRPHSCCDGSEDAALARLWTGGTPGRSGWVRRSAHKVSVDEDSPHPMVGAYLCPRSREGQVEYLGAGVRVAVGPASGMTFTAGSPAGEAGRVPRRRAEARASVGPPLPGRWQRHPPGRPGEGASSDGTGWTLTFAQPEGPSFAVPLALARALRHEELGGLLPGPPQGVAGLRAHAAEDVASRGQDGDLNGLGGHRDAPAGPGESRGGMAPVRYASSTAGNASCPTVCPVGVTMWARKASSNVSTWLSTETNLALMVRSRHRHFSRQDCSHARVTSSFFRIFHGRRGSLRKDSRAGRGMRKHTRRPFTSKTTTASPGSSPTTLRSAPWAPSSASISIFDLMTG